MKILLFVQERDERPTCPPQPKITPAMYDNAPNMAKRWGAARWWLVECDCADDGRKVIACGPRTTELWMGGQLPSGGQAPSHLVGRILASGAKGTP